MKAPRIFWIRRIRFIRQAKGRGELDAEQALEVMPLDGRGVC